MSAENGYKVILEKTADGYAAFLGNSETGLKLAVIATRHVKPVIDKETGEPIRHDGRIVEGYVPQPEEHWAIHFTSPSMRVDLLRAIVEALPTKA